MRIKLFILLGLALLFLNGCNNNSQPKNEPILYEIKEPTKFPFEVNDVSTKIDIQSPDFLHQFIFTYRNKETSQQINYILSKVLDKMENIPNSATIIKPLDNGVNAYYEETSTSQSLWWKSKDGFLARFVYFTHGNTAELGKYKLKVEDLINLANEVQ